MKVLVCLKQVPDPSVGEFDIRTGEFGPLHWLPNFLDLVALEEGLRLKESQGASVTAITMGPERADGLLRRALTSGADTAVRVWDELLEGADTWGTSAVLAGVAARVGVDLILCGVRSADNGSGTLAARLAAKLGVPLISRVVGLECRGSTVVGQSQGEKGWRDTFCAMLPAVVTVEGGLNEPRYVPILSRIYREGLTKPLHVWNLRDIEVDPDEAKPLVQSLALVPRRPRAKVGMKVSGLSMEDKLRIMRGETGKGRDEMFSGAPDEAARKILVKLDEWLR